MTAFRVGSATHVGQVRSNNQDSKLVYDEQAVFAVADGMGGHQGGEVASAIAIETLEATIADATAESVVEAVKEANRRIISRASDTTELRGMGTTLVAIALVNRGSDDEEIAWVNVGDSRAYLLRDGELVQLSRDHSLVEDLRRGGQLSEEEAAVHPQRNILTRALGIDREVEVDHDGVMPFLGDRFLLCSDGLFNEVDRDTITATLGIEDPDAAAEELVRLANEGGGRDNITCVIVDVIDDNGRAARAAELAAAAAAAAAAREAAGEDEEAVEEIDVDTVETVPAAANAALASGAAGADPPTEVEPEVEPGVVVDDDPTPPNGTPLPPPPPVEPTADAPTEPATIDPDTAAAEATPVDGEVAPIAAGPSTDPGLPTTDDEPASSARFINPGFPTADDDPGTSTDGDELPFGADRPSYQDPDSGSGRHRAKIAVIIGVIALLVGAVFGGLAWYGRQGYFVTTRGEAGEIVIYQGKAGGFLIFDPTFVEGSDATLGDADGDARRDVIDKRTFSSLGAARTFVGDIEEAADAERSTTTTGSTTTTERGSTTTGASTPASQGTAPPTTARPGTVTTAGSP